jgi:hypothetical protein
MRTDERTIARLREALRELEEITERATMALEPDHPTVGEYADWVERRDLAREQETSPAPPT